MDITLRKANALQHEIRAALKARQPVAVIRMNEFEDAQSRLVQAREDWAVNRRRCEGLRAALYEIRSRIANSNTECGISPRLAEMAALDETIAMLRGAAETRPRPTADVLAGMQAKLVTSTERRLYGGSDALEVGIFDADAIEGFRQELAALRRRKRELQDQLLSLNIETRITLSEEAQAALKEEGIL